MKTAIKHIVFLDTQPTILYLSESHVQIRKKRINMIHPYCVLNQWSKQFFLLKYFQLTYPDKFLKCWSILLKITYCMYNMWLLFLCCMTGVEKGNKISLLHIWWNHCSWSRFDKKKVSTYLLCGVFPLGSFWPTWRQHINFIFREKLKEHTHVKWYNHGKIEKARLEKFWSCFVRFFFARKEEKKTDALVGRV
jgi:hypothetical protein